MIFRFVYNTTHFFKQEILSINLRESVFFYTRISAQSEIPKLYNVSFHSMYKVKLSSLKFIPSVLTPKPNVPYQVDHLSNESKI